MGKSLRLSYTVGRYDILQPSTAMEFDILLLTFCIGLVQGLELDFFFKCFFVLYLNCNKKNERNEKLLANTFLLSVGGVNITYFHLMNTVYLLVYSILTSKKKLLRLNIGLCVKIIPDG